MRRLFSGCFVIIAIIAPLLLSGCGKRQDGQRTRSNPLRQLMGQGKPATPGVWNQKSCDEGCDDADMSRPIKRPNDGDYVKCYKECE